MLLGGVALAVVMVLAFHAFRGSTLARQDMDAHLEFPATYHGRDEAFDGDRMILRADGTATLDGIILGKDEKRSEDGRPCINGDLTAVSGDARWWADDSAWVFLEAEGRRSRLHPDDPLLMAEGWGKVYLLTPCSDEYSAIFLTPDARY